MGEVPLYLQVDVRSSDRGETPLHAAAAKGVNPQPKTLNPRPQTLNP